MSVVHQHLVIRGNYMEQEEFIKEVDILQANTTEMLEQLEKYRTDTLSKVRELLSTLSKDERRTEVFLKDVENTVLEVFRQINWWWPGIINYLDRAAESKEE